MEIGRMKNLMKGSVNGLLVAVSLVATSANALPTLFFDGEVNYSASTGELLVTSVLTATEDLGSLPTLSGSSLSFSAFFAGAETSSVVSGGAFNSATISVIDGNSNNLLAGDLTDLFMIGRSGRNSGRISGSANATSGLFADMFGAGVLRALEFNLLPGFSADMFDADFTSRIDGSIEGEAVSVPEPGMLALLGMGLALVSLPRRRSKQI